MYKSRFIITLILACTLLFVIGCGKQQATTPTTPVIRVGAETTFPPFEFQDEKTQAYVGFDMDLIRAIGKQLGYEVEISSMGFDALIPSLDSGQIDVIISAMTITDDRAKKVGFSAPYYQSGLSIVVNKANNDIQGFADLAGKRIAVQIGTTGAEESKKIPQATVREYNSPSEAYMELKVGGVDAVVNDLPVNQYYLAQGGNRDAKAINAILHSESYGIAVNKSNTELLAKINTALSELKANGEYTKIYEQWFDKQIVPAQ